jgi:hypothetical protein
MLDPEIKIETARSLYLVMMLRNEKAGVGRCRTYHMVLSSSTKNVIWQGEIIDTENMILHAIMLRRKRNSG